MWVGVRWVGLVWVGLVWVDLVWVGLVWVGLVWVGVMCAALVFCVWCLPYSFPGKCVGRSLSFLLRQAGSKSRLDCVSLYTWSRGRGQADFLDPAFFYFYFYLFFYLEVLTRFTWMRKMAILRR